MKKRFCIMTARYAALGAVLIGIVAGCAPRRGRYDELYAQLQEEPAALDQSVLAGRRIAIDPGHGGYFEGAIGVDSLTEADVNLGVALYLWGFLNEAGAEVVLTRSTDRDFLPEGSSELRDDLERRMRTANEFKPDVFISIHHNANLPVDREFNRIEIYYRGDDPEASLEFARDVRLHLARNLGIEEAEIKPGNYYVLSNSEAGASILGEASYLSHPIVEQRLKLANKQMIEAESYFLGLITYFSRGVPSIERIAPASDTLDAPAEIAFSVKRGAHVPLDISSAKITIDDREVTPFFEPETETIRWALDSDARNGIYTVRTSIRSVRGGTATAGPYTLLLSRPARYLLPLPPARGAGGTVACRVKVLDQLGQPVADGLRVTATSIDSSVSFHGHCRNGILSFEAPEEIATGPFLVETRGICDTIRFDRAVPEGSRPLVAVDERTGTGVPFPLATTSHYGTFHGNDRGVLQVPRTLVDSTLIVTAMGYRPAMFEPEAGARTAPGGTDDLVRLTPIYGGLLRGKRIALDPAGGGSDHGGIGRGKLRGASINLEVAKRVRDMLTRAGAVVWLTRTGEETISVEERVHRVNSGRAELAIGIHHGTTANDPSCRILHYPGSERGKALAAALSEILREMPPCAEYTIGESAATFLQQTICSTCEIHAGPVFDPSVESILGHPRYAHLAAERILSAIIRYVGGTSETWRERTIAVLKGGQPVPGAAVCIDQTVHTSTDPHGYARFSCIDPGRHAVTIDIPGDPAHEIHFVVFPEVTSDTLTIDLAPK